MIESKNELRCLIVDDDLTSRTLLESMLSPHASCELATNGEEAIAAFEESYNNGTPFKLVCLDIMMPNLDGHGVLQTIRSFEMDQEIPTESATKVIVLSALEDGQNVFHALSHGSESYLVKPIAKATLFRELRRLGLISQASLPN